LSVCWLNEKRFSNDFMTEEIFDIVNERDEVVGQNTRREVHARGNLGGFYLTAWPFPS
jgi:hypothetical protein